MSEACDNDSEGATGRLREFLEDLFAFFELSGSLGFEKCLACTFDGVTMLDSVFHSDAALPALGGRESEIFLGLAVGVLRDAQIDDGFFTMLSPFSIDCSVTSTARREGDLDSGGVGYDTDAELRTSVSFRDVCSCGRRGTSKSLAELEIPDEAEGLLSCEGAERSVDSRT